VVVCCGRILRSGRRLDCSAPFFWSHNGRAIKAEPGEKRDTAKTSITIGADSQKVLDLTTPNREDNALAQAGKARSIPTPGPSGHLHNGARVEHIADG
jgi:hypothetical protein